MGAKHDAIWLARRRFLSKEFDMAALGRKVVRIDQFLHAARAFKSRTDAREACAGGGVLVNGVSVKASHAVRVGDEIRTKAPRGTIVWRILALSEKRLSPALARA